MNSYRDLSQKIEFWKKEIDRLTTSFQESFGTLTAEELNWKPASDKWSIAQNIDHLILINQSYFPVINSIREHTYKPPFIAKLGFVVRFFGKTVLNAVNPDRRRKIKTFSIWEPAVSTISPDILDKFNAQQQQLKQTITGSWDLLQKQTVISSPANQKVVYTLDTAYDIIVTHEQRHFEQAKEVLSYYRLRDLVDAAD